MDQASAGSSNTRLEELVRQVKEAQSSVNDIGAQVLHLKTKVEERQHMSQDVLTNLSSEESIKQLLDPSITSRDLIQQIFADKDTVLRRLEQENALLKTRLDEFRASLELVAVRSESAFTKMRAVHKTEVSRLGQDLAQEKQSNEALRYENMMLRSKISEMTEVMRKAVAEHEEDYQSDIRVNAQLMAENTALREVIGLSPTAPIPSSLLSSSSPSSNPPELDGIANGISHSNAESQRQIAS